MNLADVLASVWQQVMADGRPVVTLDGHEHTVGRTSRQGLRTVTFTNGDRLIEGIEQNPEKSSRWAKLAQEGKRVMQFRCGRTYIGNVCEGKLTLYSAGKSLGSPNPIARSSAEPTLSPGRY